MQGSLEVEDMHAQEQLNKLHAIELESMSVANLQLFCCARLRAVHGMWRGAPTLDVCFTCATWHTRPYLLLDLSIDLILKRNFVVCQRITSFWAQACQWGCSATSLQLRAEGQSQELFRLRGCCPQ